AVQTMWPSPWATSNGPNVLTPWTTPSTLTSTSQRQVSTLVSSSVPVGATPALRQATCTAPKPSSAALPRASTSSAERTSHRTARTTAPMAPRASAVSASAASSTSASTTRAPAPARASARARPIPPAAPVTTPTLSVRSRTSGVLRRRSTLRPDRRPPLDESGRRLRHVARGAREDLRPVLHVDGGLDVGRVEIGPHDLLGHHHGEGAERA